MTHHKVRPFLSIAIALGLALPGFSCSQKGETATRPVTAPESTISSPTSQQPAAGSQPGEDQSTEDKIVLAVSQAIRKNHLTDRADECLAYQFDPGAEREYYTVDVRENHHYAKCGGDPNTSPRLFSVRVMKKSGKMSTDQGSPAGTFRPLPD